MLGIIVGTVIWGSLHGALQENEHTNTATGASPCEIQTAVRGSEGQVLYYTCKY